jgi:MSHA biogenesis protein MshE
LVTGPTGSGKTTTLYGALSELNKPEVKIITAEDPVEYRLPRLTQVQVNAKVGLDFSTVLRSALRQDPDVILVGEMRDQETAEIGLRAAMTGHLVLSTLHTNDSVSSAMRLTDMGAEPYLVASSLLGVLAQRLVRKICENCAQPYSPTDQEKIWLQAMSRSGVHIPGEFTKGSGCYQCSNTGYKGRMGVYEWLEMDEDMLDALRRNAPSEFTAAAKRSRYYQPLELCALEYAKEAKTTLDEVFRLSATLEDTEHRSDVADINNA